MTMPPGVDGHELPIDSELRRFLPESMRCMQEMYSVTLDGKWAGITDEYGTCHYAAEGFTSHEIEDRVLAP